MKTKKPTTERWKTLALPEEHHSKLKKLAKSNHRTISGQMAAMIDDATNNSSDVTVVPAETAPAK